MPKALNILGASARAAAQSAARAGYDVCAVDLFADRDTQQIARARRIENYPGDFLTAAVELPPGPWMYTGGLENHAAIVDAIAAKRALWGNSGDVLRGVRDPLAWTQELSRAGLATPRVTRDLAAVPRDGTWLAKPLRSGGGIGIRVVDAVLHLSADAAQAHYFQQKVAGTCASFVFVAARRKAALLGATRQLSGTRWASREPFLYAGSIGPLPLSDALAATLKHIASVLAAAFDLTGLVGVDGVMNDEGFWPIEINPRYVASIEILERASGANFVEFHAAACENADLPSDAMLQFNCGMHGKAILYTPVDAIFGDAAAAWAERSNAAQPVVADIPATGEPIPAGQPVATLFAAGQSEDEVREKLDQRREELRGRLS